jgi:hypothetical protein
MPNVQQNPAINARRFAALLAGFDTGNACEEEALSKGRALRRMASDAGLRVVDVLELPDVKRAIDDQLRPARKEGPELQEAVERAEALREELTERTRDVRKLAELLRQQEETTETLRGELAAARSRPVPVHGVPARPSLGAQSWVFETGTVLLALALLMAALCGGHFQEGSNGDELGNGQGKPAAVVRTDRAIRPVPEPRALHHRQRHGGSSAGTR